MNRARIPFALLLLGLTACGADPSVRELSQITGDNAARVAIDLDALARKSRAIATARAELAGHLAAVLAEDRVLFERDLAIAKLSGGSQNQAASRYAELHELADTWASRQAEVANVAITTRDAVLAEQVDLAAPSRELREVGQMLIQLSKADRGAGQLAFLIAFTEGVVQEIQKEQDENEKKADETESAAGDPPTESAAKRSDECYELISKEIDVMTQEERISLSLVMLQTMGAVANLLDAVEFHLRRFPADPRANALRRAILELEGEFAWLDKQLLLLEQGESRLTPPSQEDVDKVAKKAREVDEAMRAERTAELLIGLTTSVLALVNDVRNPGHMG